MKSSRFLALLLSLALCACEPFRPNLMRAQVPPAPALTPLNQSIIVGNATSGSYSFAGILDRDSPSDSQFKTALERSLPHFLLHTKRSTTPILYRLDANMDFDSRGIIWRWNFLRLDSIGHYRIVRISDEKVIYETTIRAFFERPRGAEYRSNDIGYHLGGDETIQTMYDQSISNNIREFLINLNAIAPILIQAATK